MLDMMQRNIFLDFSPQTVGMVCGRRKYSSKYGMVLRVCNMSLVSQESSYICGPWARINPSLFHISRPRLGWNPRQRAFLTPPLRLACGLCAAWVG